MKRGIRRDIEGELEGMKGELEGMERRIER